MLYAVEVRETEKISYNDNIVYSCTSPSFLWTSGKVWSQHMILSLSTVDGQWCFLVKPHDVVYDITGSARMYNVGSLHEAHSLTHSCWVWPWSSFSTKFAMIVWRYMTYLSYALSLLKHDVRMVIFLHTRFTVVHWFCFSELVDILVEGELSTVQRSVRYDVQCNALKHGSMHIIQLTQP